MRAEFGSTWPPGIIPHSGGKAGARGVCTLLAATEGSAEMELVPVAWGPKLRPPAHSRWEMNEALQILRWDRP